MEKYSNDVHSANDYVLLQDEETHAPTKRGPTPWPLFLLIVVLGLVQIVPLMGWENDLSFPITVVSKVSSPIKSQYVVSRPDLHQPGGGDTVRVAHEYEWLTMETFRTWRLLQKNDPFELVFVNFLKAPCVSCGWDLVWARTVTRIVTEYQNARKPLLEAEEGRSSRRWVLHFARVDCSREIALCSEEGIASFPTWRFFHKGKAIRSDYNEIVSMSDDPTGSTTSAVNSVVHYLQDKLRLVATINEKYHEVNKVGIPIQRLKSSESTSALMELTDANFNGWVYEHGDAFVTFYAPWCVWCQRLLPSWERFAEEMRNSELGVGKVDCVAEADLCRHHKILAFPTLRWFRNGKPVTPDYKGERTVSDFKIFATQRMTMVGDDELSVPSQPERGLDENDDAVGAGHSEEEKPNIGSEDEEEDTPEDADIPDAVDGEGVKSISRLDSREDKGEGEDEIRVEREGDSEDEGEDIAESNVVDPEAVVIESVVRTATAPLFQPSSHLAQVTNENFDSWIQETAFAFVAFCKPDCVWCQRVAPTWERFSSEIHQGDKNNIMGKKLGIGYVECHGDEKELCKKQDVMAFPTFRWYENGIKVAPDYKMDRTVFAMTRFAKERMGLLVD